MQKFHYLGRTTITAFLILILRKIQEIKCDAILKWLCVFQVTGNRIIWQHTVYAENRSNQRVSVWPKFRAVILIGFCSVEQNYIYVNHNTKIGQIYIHNSINPDLLLWDCSPLQMQISSLHATLSSKFLNSKTFNIDNTRTEPVIL